MGIKKRIAMGKLKLPESKREGNTYKCPDGPRSRRNHCRIFGFTPNEALAIAGALTGRFAAPNVSASPQIEKLRDIGHTESVIEQITEYVNGESGTVNAGTQLRPEEAQPSGHDDVGKA